MGKFRSFFELIKFEHTVFALPFAYLGMLLAKRSIPNFRVFFWITMAMVGARTAGMTLNRIIDRPMDSKNPRTKNRPSVTGEISSVVTWLAVVISFVLFFISTFNLNPLCFKASFVAIVFLSGYHYVKRFSFLCHFVLGIVLAMAPIGGWMAVTGHFSPEPVWLSLAVCFWVAGFDIIYSLQDMEFDRHYGLHSIPARFGALPALKSAAGCHAATVLFLLVFGWTAHLGIVYWAGIVVVGVLLGFEHSLVEKGNLTKIDAAFFTVNSWVGVLLLVFTFLEIL